MILALLAAVLPRPTSYPAVLDVIEKRHVPGRRVRIHAFRDNLWRTTDVVNSADVEWNRLLPGDRVETVADPS